MFEANIWFWLFLLGSGPSKEQLAAEIRKGIEAERIANDPVHRARRAREEAQRIADEEEEERIADEEEEERIAYLEAADAAQAKMDRQFWIWWCCLMFFLFLVYVTRFGFTV